MSASLRETYEQFDKPLSDRHWRRLRKRLLAFTNSGQKIIDVRDAARLRKINPRAKIDLDTVRQCQKYMDAFPEFGCSGKDLLEGIKRILINPPTIRTIYRWGEAIDCPFSFERFYEPEEVRLWVQKIVSQSRFKLKYSPPPIRY